MINKTIYKPNVLIHNNRQVKLNRNYFKMSSDIRVTVDIVSATHT